MPRHARGWFHFSLRTLLIVIVVLAVVFALLARMKHKYIAEQQVKIHYAKRLAFLEQLDLAATVKRLAPKETSWSHHGTSSGGQLHDARYSAGVRVAVRGGEWDKSCTLRFQCGTENLDELIGSIERELRTRFQKSGAKVTNGKDSETRLDGFDFTYIDGGVTGTVRAEVETIQDSSHPFKLIIKVHEEYDIDNVDI